MNQHSYLHTNIHTNKPQITRALHIEGDTPPLRTFIHDLFVWIIQLFLNNPKEDPCAERRECK